MSEEDDSKLGPAGVLLFTLCLIVMLAIIGVPFYFASKSVDNARTLADEILEKYRFTPEIIVNNITVVQQERTIPDLGAKSTEFDHTLIWKNVDPTHGPIIIKGKCEARVGFDVRKKLEISINGSRAMVVFPEPEVLELQSDGHVVDPGYDKAFLLSDSANQRALDAFEADARNNTSKALVSKVKEDFEPEFRKLLAAHVEEIEFRYRKNPRKNPEGETATESE